jgi:hypothetical protein
VIDPLKNDVVKASCNCEGFTFKKECWHIKVLKEMVKDEFADELDLDNCYLINWGVKAKRG